MKNLNKDYNKIIAELNREIEKRKAAEEEILKLNKRLEERNRELEAEKEKWQSVIEGIADEVRISDLNGIISLINVPQ